MGARKQLRMAMLDKGITSKDVAAKLNKPISTIYNTFTKDAMSWKTVVMYADAIGCDVVIRDRVTGKCY